MWASCLSPSRHLVGRPPLLPNHNSGLWFHRASRVTAGWTLGLLSWGPWNWSPGAAFLPVLEPRPKAGEGFVGSASVGIDLVRNIIYNQETMASAFKEFRELWQDLVGSFQKLWNVLKPQLSSPFKQADSSALATIWALGDLLRWPPTLE